MNKKKLNISFNQPYIVEKFEEYLKIFEDSKRQIMLAGTDFWK